MSETVTLADIERLCWKLSGWTVEQRSVDRLLSAVRTYAGYGTDAGPHVEGASALAVEGGEGEPETRRGPSADLVLMDDMPQAATGPQTGTQRIELSGSVTLLCARPARKRTWAVPAGPVPEGSRACRTCGAVHPFEHYGRDAHSPQGRRTACRDCENKRKRMARLVWETS